MNKYPALYEAVDGKRYLYTDKDNYYSFERNCWDKSDSADNHENDKNITAEYLVNTKVKIESEEHSELVQDLVFNAGGSWSSGSVQIKNLGAEWHFIDCELLISNSYQRDCDKVNMRLITIPLPPKEKSMSKVQINVKNNTDSVVHVTKSDDESNIFIQVNDLPKSEEWPQVGDDVITASVKGTLTANATVLAVENGEVWIKYHDDKQGYNSVRVATLTKPPTPEDELESKLSALMSSDSCNSCGDIAKAIINGEIEGLEYKPQ